jgi:hypothetical protein
MQHAVLKLNGSPEDLHHHADCQCLGIDGLGQVAGSGTGPLDAVENPQQVDQALFKARQ